MQIVDVDGGQVAVRDASEITGRGRRALHARVLQVGAARVIEAFTYGPQVKTEDLADLIGLTAEEEAALQGIAAAAVLAAIDSWTLPFPLPSSPEELLALPGVAQDAADEAAGGEAERVLREALGL